MDEIQGTEQPQESMDDFMESAFDDIEAQDNPVEETEPVIGTSEEPLVEASEDTEPETDTSDTAEDEGKSDEPVDGQTVTAPQSMSAEHREKFYALPEDQQQFIAERAKEQEASFTKKSMELADQRRAYGKVEEVMAPRRQQLAMDGMDDGTAIGQLFALSDFANENPVGFVQYLLSQRGIPMSALTESGGAQASADPQLTAMQREIHGLKSHFTQQAAAQQNQVARTVTSDIESFASAHPFYSELEAEMIPLVAGFRQSYPGLTNADYLEKAYKSAIAVNDTVSAKISADTNAKRLAETKKVADKAKRANGTNLRSRATLPAGAARAKSEDDFIGALVDDRMSA